MQRASDVLASASLLLTVVTVLFSLWYPEIKYATEVSIPEHLEDASNQRQIVSKALGARVRPLLAGTIVIAITFFPIVLWELFHSWRNVRLQGLAAITDYNPATIALTAVVAVDVYLAWILFHQRRELMTLKGRLTPNSHQSG